MPPTTAIASINPTMVQSRAVSSANAAAGNTFVKNAGMGRSFSTQSMARRSGMGVTSAIGAASRFNSQMALRWPQ
jgi:hypothetical protein